MYLIFFLNKLFSFKTLTTSQRLFLRKGRVNLENYNNYVRQLAQFFIINHFYVLAFGLEGCFCLFFSFSLLIKIFMVFIIFICRWFVRQYGIKHFDWSARVYHVFDCCHGSRCALPNTSESQVPTWLPSSEDQRR